MARGAYLNRTSIIHGVNVEFSRILSPLLVVEPSLNPLCEHLIT